MNNKKRSFEKLASETFSSIKTHLIKESSSRIASNVTRIFSISILFEKLLECFEKLLCFFNFSLN